MFLPFYLKNGELSLMVDIIIFNPICSYKVYFCCTVVLMQHGKPILFHFEIFNGVVTNYPTYGKELYALVQSVKKLIHYLMGKETNIHINHQPSQYLQSQ